MTATTTEVSAAAEREAALTGYQTLLAEWQHYDRAIISLERDGVWISEDEASRSGRTMRSATAPQGRRMTDPIERDLAIDELRRKKIDLAPQVAKARRRLELANVAVANEGLAHLAEEHKRATTAVANRLSACERLYIELVVHAVLLAEAKAEETAVANKGRKLATTLAPAAVREEVGQVLDAGDFVVELDAETGTPRRTQARPDSGLFGLHGASWRIGTVEWADELLDNIGAGRHRWAATADRVAALLYQTLERIERNFKNEVKS